MKKTIGHKSQPVSCSASCTDSHDMFHIKFPVQELLNKTILGLQGLLDFGDKQH